MGEVAAPKVKTVRCSVSGRSDGDPTPSKLRGVTPSSIALGVSRGLGILVLAYYGERTPG